MTVICESSIFSAVKLPCFSILDDLAEPGAVGRERDVDVLVEILGGQAAARAGRGGLVRRHADDPEVVILADADRLADRIAIGEELLGGLGAEHGDVGAIEQVGVGQESAVVHVLAGQLEEVGVDPDDAPLDLLLEVADVLAELPQRRRARRRWEASR